MSLTKNSYNLSAEKYNEKFSDYTPYRKQISKFSDILEEKSYILDAGCGPGLNAAIFSEAGHRVSGFDFSESMISLAEQNCPEGKFEVASAGDFRTDEKFDALCLSFVIVHLENDKTEDLINRLHSMLKPDGKVYISFMTGKEPGCEKTSFSDSEIYFNYFEKDYIRKLFTEAGFSCISTESLPYEETDGSVTEDVFMFFRKIS